MLFITRVLIRYNLKYVFNADVFVFNEHLKSPFLAELLAVLTISIDVFETTKCHHFITHLCYIICNGPFLN